MSRRPFTKALEALQEVQDALGEELENAHSVAVELQEVLAETDFATDPGDKAEMLDEYLTVLLEHLNAAQKLVALE